MHVVVNRVALKEPLPESVLALMQEELPERTAHIEGLHSFHVVGTGELELTLLILGTAEAIEQTRTEFGNEFMREHVMPYAAAQPERAIGEALFSYER